MPNDPEGGQPKDGPVLECWAVLAGLAACTEHVRLGPLVSGNLYRHPAVVAKSAAAIDQISGGRFVLGLGAGWQVNEHAAYGIDLLDVRTRLDRFEEACIVTTSLLRQPRTTFAGRHYTLTDAPCDPKPVQERLPLLLGGQGEKRMLGIVARHADEWNAWCTPELFRAKSAVLDQRCEELGRDPAEIRRSTQALVFMSDDEAWLAKRRDQATGRPVLIGSPAEVAEQVGAYAAVGVEELIIPDWTMGRLERAQDTLRVFWTEVAAHFR
jgi:alkanesulfonate monooxygenase SsuD/methylene tetrahydromethanopterin reductase-like flavin-dependent oxidoreductase (luciferase family)